MPPVNKYLQLQQAERVVASPPPADGGNHPAPSPSHSSKTSRGTAVGRDQALAESSSAIMNKVAILTSSTHEPGVNIRHRSLVALLGPSVDLAVRLQRLVAVASSLLVVYGHLLASSTLTSGVVATRLFLAHSAWASQKTFRTLQQSTRNAWNSKKIRRLRKKVFMEFATTILGPGGNMLIVLVFWPGWIFIVGALVAMRVLAG